MRTVLLIVVLLLPLSLRAQRSGFKWEDSSEWGSRSRYGKLYNAKSVETITGEIVKVEEVHPYSGMKAGIHLQLKSSKESIWVHLGPAWYVLNQGMELKVSDVIKVTGSRASFANKQVIVAKEIVKGEDHLQLRDDLGTPFWCSKCFPVRK